MKEFIESLAEGSKINILSKEYVAIGCVDYVMFNQPESAYTKVYFSGHRVLLLVILDNFASLGKNMGIVVQGDDFGQSISFRGKEYELQTNDYQIVKCVRFGNPVELEGEVEFWDYTGIDNSKSLISIAKVTKTGERADVVAVEINEADFQIVK